MTDHFTICWMIFFTKFDKIVHAFVGIGNLTSFDTFKTTICRYNRSNNWDQFNNFFGSPIERPHVGNCSKWSFKDAFWVNQKTWAKSKTNRSLGIQIAFRQEELWNTLQAPMLRTLLRREPLGTGVNDGNGMFFTWNGTMDEDDWRWF